jgi:UDP-glucose 4-epimerase
MAAVRLVVTGSAGHLGDALVRTLSNDGHEVLGLDVTPSPSTTIVGNIGDREVVRRCVGGAGAVIHAATLHKPHIVTHSKSDFVETNVLGTLGLLEESIRAGVSRFVFVSTTSTFGRAIPGGARDAAVWITEEVAPIPRNIYGATKIAAEDLCDLVHRESGMPCVILRMSRFFPEGDDVEDRRAGYDGLNLKVNELLYRRVDIEDAVAACQVALERAASIGFGRYIISATTPFSRQDVVALRREAPSVVWRLYPDYEEIFAGRGWKMLETIDRVYDNGKARLELGWSPRYDFAHAMALVAAGKDPRSPLALAVGAKGYHPARP